MSYRCKSGRHTWSEYTDAKRCCNGYHRVLATTTLVQAYKASAVPAQSYTPLLDPEFAGLGFAWFEDTPGRQYLGHVGIPHDHTFIPRRSM